MVPRPAAAARPAEAGRPAAAGADAGEAADTGQLSSSKGEPHPRTTAGSGPGPGPAVVCPVCVLRHARACARDVGACAEVEQLSCGAL
ncbi:hypothetical protein DMT42_20855 [Streptomyces actuosus]|uniref:Uncharacterized protein n=1 Tax=Streptomyces actuosus TaxID=1885 RepID=A0A2U9P4R3_STRAS|nr:hypothetical protein DMT42_20855 [Streptomyces actuosus]